jgi:adenine phosphoribosyltransferase
VTEVDLRELVRTIHDFPKPGIAYRDITPVLSDAAALRTVVDSIADHFRGEVDAVVGVESRGFIIGAPVAYALGTGLTLVRKAGKLPSKIVSEDYELEYGSDSLEIHSDALGTGVRTLLVDDLLATGGTAAATVKLVEGLGAKVTACAFVIELKALGGRGRLAPRPTFSLIQYSD